MLHHILYTGWVRKSKPDYYCNNFVCCQLTTSIVIIIIIIITLKIFI